MSQHTFTFVDGEVMVESMAEILHNTADLAKYTKVERLMMGLINFFLTAYFKFDGQT